MMRIFSLFFLLLFLISPSMAVSTWTAMEGVSSFILKHNGTQEVTNKIINGNRGKEGCFQTSTHLICYEFRKYSNSPQYLQPTIRALALKTKKALYFYLLRNEKNKNFINQSAIERIYINGVVRGEQQYNLQGIEIVNYHEGTTIISIASVPYKSANVDIHNILKSPSFVNDYCAYLFPKAIKYFSENNYEKALVILSELYDLKWENAQAYIMASYAFLKTGNYNKSLKIAYDVLLRMKKQLTLELAEQLGDIFLELGYRNEAIECLNIAVKK